MTLSLENFSLFTNNKQIITALSLNVPHLCIMGPSGSGKSSLIKAILGLGNHWQAKGVIRFHDIIVQKDNQKLVPLHQRRFAYVPQHLALWPHVSAEQSLILSKNFSQSSADCPLLIEQLKLQHVKHHLPHQMSHGEQQRLAIGRALAAEPQLLVLDEPFASLDIITRMTLLQIIKELRNKQHFATILITHDLKEAYFFNDELIILKDGHVLWQGKAVDIPHDLPQWPVLRYYREFYGYPGVETCSRSLNGNGSFMPTPFS